MAHNSNEVCMILRYKLVLSVTIILNMYASFASLAMANTSSNECPMQSLANKVVIGNNHARVILTNMAKNGNSYAYGLVLESLFFRSLTYGSSLPLIQSWKNLMLMNANHKNPLATFMRDHFRYSTSLYKRGSPIVFSSQRNMSNLLKTFQSLAYKKCGGEYALILGYVYEGYKTHVNSFFVSSDYHSNGNLTSKLWRYAAKENVPTAMYLLGKFKGEIGSLLHNSPRFCDKSLYYLKTSLRQGYEPSAALLGKYYNSGVCVKKSYTKAVKYFKRAAEKNVSSGLYYLGWNYLSGKGVKANINQGYDLIRRSASGHYKPANKSFVLLNNYFDAIAIVNGTVKNSNPQITGIPNNKWAVAIIKKAAKEGVLSAQKRLTLMHMTN